MSKLVGIINSLGEDEHTLHTLVEWFNVNLKRMDGEFTKNDLKQYLRIGVPLRYGNITIELIDVREKVKIYKLTDKRRKYNEQQNKSLHNN